MRRFAALSAIRRGREIWAIGFDHEFPEGDVSGDLSHAEAMKHTAQLASVNAQDLQRVFPCVALMNHDIESKLDREIELLLEQTCLLRFARAVANLRFDFFIGLASQSSHNLHLLFPSYS